MTKENDKLSGMRYSCNTCDAWIPESEAIIGDGNVGRFCSSECLEKWCAQQRKNEEEKKK